MRTSPFQSACRSAVGVALVTAFILLLPLLAMQFTEEVAWDAGDFAVAGALLFGIGLTYELMVRRMDSVAYRLATGVALAAALLLVWLNLAVGIIGKEDDPANGMYYVVLAVAIIGSICARLKPRAMALALVATAIAQALVAAIAVAGGLGGRWSGPLEILLLNGFFVALFVGSAWLFRRAARTEAGR